jgi:non-ribosomal peptide synthetase component F
MHDPAYTPLTPPAFLGRSAAVFADKVAVVSPGRRLTYRELADEAMRVAQGLRACGVRPGDRVAYLAPNLPELVRGRAAEDLHRKGAEVRAAREGVGRPRPAHLRLVRWPLPHRSSRGHRCS